MTALPPPPPPSDPRAAVSGPAIFLMITAGVGIVYQIVMLAFNALGTGASALAGRQGILNMLSGGVGMAFNVIAILLGVVVFLGAMKMKNLQNYGFAMGAAIIAMIPCISPCCLLGLPAGIWAIVMLVKPEVKAAFTGGDHGLPTV